MRIVALVLLCLCGDRLIIRVAAGTRAAATRQVETLVQAVAPPIVGRRP